MLLTQSFSRVHAASGTERKILQVMKGLEDQFNGDLTGGGAPQILFNTRTREVWVSSGDWHESDLVQEVFDALEGVSGVEGVDGESESYPAGYHYGQGESDWEKIYPK
jgi:hypothetical protein